MVDTLRNRFAPATQGRRKPKIFRRFTRDEKGATAVEFAMVALPFLGAMFVILETALVFLAGQVLETAVADGARLVMTGQAQTGSVTPEDFKKKICDGGYGLFTCETLQVETKSYKSFSSADMSQTPVNGFGGPNCVVIVRASYNWPIFTNPLGLHLADTPDGARKIVATAAFRNEPYGGTGSC
jgi:Flp pilus assembly pilin Flp